MDIIVKIRILIPCCIIFCSISCLSQSAKQTYTTMYDLKFTMNADSSVVAPWQENAAYLHASLPAFTQIEGRRLFRKIYGKEYPFSDRLRTEMEQRILLPLGDKKSGMVALECAGKNIQRISVLLQTFDKEERILSSDTMNFVPDTVLGATSKELCLHRAELLHIRIHAEGEKNKQAHVTFSGLNLFIDGKPIDAYPLRELTDTDKRKFPYHVSIVADREIPLEQIKEIGDRRIIALGESVHGNEKMKQLAYRLMLRMAENDNCRLILLEMPMEKSLACNRYIREKEYELDSLLQIDKVTRVFLDTLRDFNANRPDGEKVKLLGIDYNTFVTGRQNSALDIFDFIISLKMQKDVPEINRFALLLMQQDWNRAVAFLQTHREAMGKILTVDELAIISHILPLSNNMGNNSMDRSTLRDSVMFLNTRFLIDRFSPVGCGKVAVYGHTVHLNPVSTYPTGASAPFGRYMSETYGEEYVPLLLLVGEGSTLAFDAAYNRVDAPLLPPPLHSMENLLYSVNDDLFYVPMSDDFNHLLLSRFKGSHHILREFYPFNLYQRCRGIFFIKQGVSSPEWREGQSVKKTSDRHISAVKRRKKMIDAIQKQ